MNCMKCGRETGPEQVFCEECLAEMAKYPVKPGTVVQLPGRREENPNKKPGRRRGPSTPEEQLRSMRKLIRGLAAMVLVQLVLIGCLAYPWVKDYFVGKEPLPGQNYSSLTDTQPDTTGEAGE